jgi:hypothetical protein
MYKAATEGKFGHLIFIASDSFLMGDDNVEDINMQREQLKRIIMGSIIEEDEAHEEEEKK